MSLTDRQIREQVWRAAWKTQGRAPTDADYSYWIGKWPELEARAVEVNDPNYAVKRLLGWETTGADVPKYGIYAQPPTPYRDVPQSPWYDTPLPEPPPSPSADPPSAGDTPEDEDDGAATMLDAIERVATAITALTVAVSTLTLSIDTARVRGVKVHL